MIVCDIDGVILHISRHFTRWYNKKYHKGISENPSHWRYGIDNVNVYFKEFFDTCTPHIYDYIFDDVEQYFNKLSEKYTIWLVTAFPEEHKFDRIENLSKINYANIIFSKNKKIDIVEKIKPRICIEDKPELIEYFHKAGIKVYYPERNYTKGLNGYGIKFLNWGDLYNKIHYNGRKVYGKKDNNSEKGLVH